MSGNPRSVTHSHHISRPQVTLNILFAAVEMSPLAKVGGLGDVVGSLPRALRSRGADVRVALPMHGPIERESLHPRHLLQGVRVPWPGGIERRPQRVDVWEARVRDVPVYLLENERYFSRTSVYGFDDDVERFLFFCDALVACAPHLGFRPDAVHAHDWHAALLLTRLASTPGHPWADAGRVYTIHNLALRGDFDDAFAEEHGLSALDLAVPPGVEPETALSGMAQGILHADRVNTVSDTYAREILTPEYGAGLDPLLRARAQALSGIVNGIDYDEFNPATDPALVRNFDAATLDARIENKRALQAKAGLPARDGAMIFAAVTRLFDQKGIDLVPAAFEWILASHDAQLVVLGTGDPAVEQTLLRLQDKYPDRVRIWLEFNPPLGQQIYAGCDAFLMPSRYEPCGLGQLISLRYGAVPVVRRTGGLADTVEDAGPTFDDGTGFVFDASTARDLQRACERALAAFAKPAKWQAMQQRGMRQDWSWSRAAAQYLDLYATAADDRARALEEARA